MMKIKVGTVLTIAMKEYQALEANKPFDCAGCIAHGNYRLCNNLPVCDIGDTSVIWKDVTEVAF